MIRSILWAAVVTALAGFIVSAWAWGQIPDGAQIAIHWGPSGEANGFAPKSVGLLLMPAMSLGIGALLAFLPRIDPRRANLLRSGAAYQAIAIGALLLMLALHIAAVLSATGQRVDMARIVPVGVGMLFLGIRTPWTLSSERSWTKTHRLGGYLFAAFGAMMVVVGVIDPQAMVWALIPGLVVVTGVPIVYSYLVWRTDPDRQYVEPEQ
jgi:uncharacterized membrane protein